jgi:LTXXQ motif family protein
MRLAGTVFLSIAIATMATPMAAQEPGFAQRMIDRMCNLTKQPVDENRGVERLSHRLNLTDAQKATLKDLTDASTKSQADARTAICADKPNLSTTPARMAFGEKVLEQRLEGMKAVQPKLQAFYDSLDDKQKAAFDSGGRVGGIFSFFNRWR